MADIESALISEVAASNTAAPPDGAPSNFPRTEVKSLFRELWAGVKREWNRTHATLTSAGTAPAFTLTPVTAIAATYITGQMYTFIAHAGTGGAMTLNVSGRGAKKCFDITGVTQLTTGAFITGTRVMVVYSTALDAAAGGWCWLNQGIQTPTTVTNIAAIGTVADFAGTSAPTGWLFCYGQNVSRTTYAALFAVTSTVYGVGDGSTTFGLPDLRGRATFGKDDMGGSAANRVTNAASGVTGTTLGNAGGSQLLASHGHSVTDPTHTHTLHGTAGAGFITNAGSGTSGAGGNTGLDAGVGADAAATGISIVAAGAGSSANMPPAFITNKMIYAGV